MISKTEMPEWRKAWKVDDKQWMKERKAKWKVIKKRLPLVAWFLRKEDLEQLKNYFLYGHGEHPAPPREKWELYRYDPNCPLKVEAPVIFECWLSADQSDAYFNKVLERNVVEQRHGDGRVEYSKSLIKTSRRRFRELVSGPDFPAEGGLFDGLEERLYHLLGPTRSRPEDFSDYNENEYKSLASQSYGFAITVLRRFLLTEKPNPHDIAHLVVHEYCDGMPIYWEELVAEGDQERIVNFSQQAARYLKVFVDIARGDQSATPMQKKVANNLIGCMPLDKLPELVREIIEPALK